MSELTVMAATVKMTLKELSLQAKALGLGLQNAAPLSKEGLPNDSVQYLLSTSEVLASQAEECEKLFLSPPASHAK